MTASGVTFNRWIGHWSNITILVYEQTGNIHCLHLDAVSSYVATRGVSRPASGRLWFKGHSTDRKSGDILPPFKELRLRSSSRLYVSEAGKLGLWEVISANKPSITRRLSGLCQSGHHSINEELTSYNINQSVMPLNIHINLSSFPIYQLLFCYFLIHPVGKR